MYKPDGIELIKLGKGAPLRQIGEMGTRPRPDLPGPPPNRGREQLHCIPGCVAKISNWVPFANKEGGRNENLSNNLLDPSGHLRTFVARCGSQLAPRRRSDQSIEFGSAITGYDRRVSNLGVRFCHDRTAAVVGEPSLRLQQR